MAMSDAVRLPRLLRGETAGGQLPEKGRLQPLSLAVTRNLEPLSTADMVLAEDDLQVLIHDFVELYGPEGSLGIYRAVSVMADYGHTRRIRLNHALDVFSDALLPEAESAGTVRQALERILACQTAAVGGVPCWKLGTVEDGGQYTLDARGGSALDALKALARDEEDYYFDYDFGGFPWTLHFLRRGEAVESEFRLSRNAERCQVTLDDGDLCTRLYLDVDGETQEVHEYAAGQAAWGVVCRRESIRTERTPDKAAWIRRYFARHGQPAVQITVEGLALHRMTGERLDALRLGGLCRAALTDYGVWLRERIVSLHYPEILRQPERVTVSLANRRPSASRAFSGLSSRAASAERAITRSEKEIRETNTRWHATDRHVQDHTEILHEAGLEIDPHGVWLFAKEITSSEAAQTALGASLKVQAQGITGLVEKTGINNLPGGYQSIMQYSSQVKQTADSVSAEVTAARDGQASLSARFSVQAAAISSKVSSTDYNGNTIASLINQTATTITLSASKIDLSGYVTASELSTQKARIDNLVGGTRVDALSASTVSAGTLMVNGSGAYWLSLRDSSGGAVTAAGGRSVQILGRYA